MRILLVILFYIFYSNIAFSATEKQFIPVDEVQESVKFIDEPLEIQEARYQIFYNGIQIPYKIDTTEYQKYFIDKTYNEKKNKTSKLKTIGYYSDGCYEWFKKGIWLRFIYKNGKILFIRKEIYNRKKEIFLDFFYEPNGNLKYIHYINKNENSKILGWIEYVFDTDKNYLGKWDNAIFYDVQNKIKLYRGSTEPFK